MANAYPIDSFPADTQPALIEFAMDFRSALAAAPQSWAEQFGLVKSTSLLQMNFPLPINAAEFKRLTGDPNFRKLSHIDLTLKLDEWQDGVEEEARNIRSGDFSGWGAQPQAMAADASELSNRLIAERLEAGTSETTNYDGLAFFSASHKVSPEGKATFSNLKTTHPLTLANVANAKKYFRQMKAPNNKTALGTRLTHIVVPADLEETARDIVESKFFLQEVTQGGSNVGGVALDNRHMNTVQVIVAEQLTNAEDWYACSFNKVGLHPWVVLKRTGGVELSMLDESSDLYKIHRKVGVNATMEMEGALGLPHCIIKMDAS